MPSPQVGRCQFLPRVEGSVQGSPPGRKREPAGVRPCLEASPGLALRLLLQPCPLPLLNLHQTEDPGTEKQDRVISTAPQVLRW